MDVDSNKEITVPHVQILRKNFLPSYTYFFENMNVEQMAEKRYTVQELQKKIDTSFEAFYNAQNNRLSSEEMTSLKEIMDSQKDVLLRYFLLSNPAIHKKIKHK